MDKVNLAACKCFISANERYKVSPEAYRMKIADSEYPKQLGELCKFDGPYPFQIKVRPLKDGGNWTFESSCEKRPLTNSIYNRGKMVAADACNRFSPLWK